VLAAAVGSRTTAAPAALLVPAAALAWLHTGELPLPTSLQAAVKNKKALVLATNSSDRATGRLLWRCTSRSAGAHAL
jgi:hypothetical protein